MAVRLANDMEIVINDGPPTGGEITVEYEQIDVTSLTKPDLSWEFVDANGHFHAYTAKGELPTTILRTERIVEVDEDDEFGEGDSYEITHRECPICGEEIFPATVASTFREFAQGRMSWKVTVPQFLVSGQQYSVRVTAGDVTRFGIAQAMGGWQATNGGTQTTLIGVSLLGERKARRPAEV